MFSRIYFSVFTKEVLILSGQCTVKYGGVQNLYKHCQIWFWYKQWVNFFNIFVKNL